jgi:hypothetical protein
MICGPVARGLLAKFSTARQGYRANGFRQLYNDLRRAIPIDIQLCGFTPC